MQTVELDTAASVSRIGGRALYPALRDLALSARLQMVQALDADEFSASKADPATAAALQQAAQYQAALRQQPAEFVPLEEQVLPYNNTTHDAFGHNICFLCRVLSGL